MNDQTWEEREAAFRNPELCLDDNIVDGLRSLVPRMLEIGYNEAEIGRCLELEPFMAKRFLHIPAYRRRLRAHGKLGCAIAFWLLQEYVPLETLRECIGDPALAALHRLNWLALGRDGVRSQVDLYPCRGQLFFTDSSYHLEPWNQQVYWLDYDSYTLAYSTPRNTRGRALDICTGSGVHAVLAASHCGHSVGVDINPRALSFSRLNAALNGLQNVEFRLSDAYAAVPESNYDLVTLNPPFVPTPEDIAELYRTGGTSGESVTERVVRGLPERLEAGGLFSMVTQAPVIAGSDPLDRLQEWLGPGWGVACLVHQQFQLDSYILSHAMESRDMDEREQVTEFERWLQCYADHKIEAMMAGQFFAVRLPQGCADWKVTRTLDYPKRDRSGQIEEWLSALTTWHQPIAAEQTLQLHHGVRQLYFGEDGVVVEFCDSDWSEGLVRYGLETTNALRQVLAGRCWSEMVEWQPTLQRLGCDLVVSLKP